MANEIQAISEFLSVHHPFDQLPAEVLTALAGQIQIRRYSNDEIVLPYGAANDWLYLIRSGAVEVGGADGELLARLSEGDVFGHRSLLGGEDDTFRAIGDTTLYRLDKQRFDELYRDHPQFQYFFGAAGPGRMSEAIPAPVQGDRASVNLISLRVAEILTRPPVTLASTVSVREAAVLMTRERVSSLMVVDQGQLRGIVTDRDLRSRVIAEGVAYDRPLRDIMTAAPVTVDVRGLAYEALLTMARSGIHHLPVIDGKRVAGMITDTDLIQRCSTSPLYLLGDIYQAADLEGLIEASKRLPQLLVALVDSNATARSIGQVVSSIGEAITCRLLNLAEVIQGPAPIPYAWLTGGSLARNEQTAHSDQDNCLLLSDAYEETSHGGYFETLARFVCDGLNACGYVYCPGEVMAMTPRWRQPLKIWKGYFDNWIDQPEPKALMHACIFFDLRRLHGDAALFAQLQEYVVDKAQRNNIFHAYMASNALQYQPPLGFLRHFVLVKDGEHDHTLDLKHRGVVPIIDVARVYALAGGIASVNTHERLEAAQRMGAISQDGGTDMLGALEYISAIRLRHQARQIREGQAPDNFVPPSQLSHFERKHLKDAFVAVRTIQSALAQRYQAGRFA